MKYKPVRLNDFNLDFIECQACGAIVVMDPDTKNSGNDLAPGRSKKHDEWHRQMRSTT